ncbi:hypothetical protein COE84_30360 [Bacillus wiedmannii]|uniref:hypothetical protein n=1 Tax=Bacillus wiedmannii TaxID=1890302 RepID=UPI000BFE7B4C|nr:hypothetical protein [Bacillus wiedmannii]PHA21446.1 hypothetical protein COE59_25875 [Bacillus wiedmannii]PHB05853.1 hypothetical protein COE84_30360 [Bacillus wiedmannii]
MSIKRKILSFVVVPMLMLMLTGVGCETKVKKDEAMEASVKQNKKEDFSKNLAYLMKDFSEQSKEIDGIVKSSKSMKKKSEELKEVSKPYLELVDKISKLEYEVKDHPVQHNVGLAMIHVKDGVEIIQEGLDKGKEYEVDGGIERLETASKLIDKANKELKKSK